MNAVAAILVGTVLVVGAGTFMVHEITHPNCKGDPMGGLPPSSTAHPIRLTIFNDDAPREIRTCMFDARGEKVFDETFAVFGDVAQYWDLYVPRPVDHWIVDGDWEHWVDLESLNHENGETCKHVPEFVYQDTAGEGWGISADCHGTHEVPQRVPGQQRLQTSTALPSPEHPLLPGGGAGLALSVSVASLLVFALRFREALQWGLLGLFTRIQAPRVLDQRVRADIHQLVQQEPGIRPVEIAHRLELAAGQTVHHLRVLVQANSLTVTRDGFARHYFVRGQHPPQRMQQIAALRAASMAKLHRALNENPGAPLSTLANLGGISKPRASRLARRLQELGLARAERHGKNLRLYPLN